MPHILINVYSSTKELYTFYRGKNGSGRLDSWRQAVANWWYPWFHHHAMAANGAASSSREKSLVFISSNGLYYSCLIIATCHSNHTHNHGLASYPPCDTATSFLHHQLAIHFVIHVVPQLSVEMLLCTNTTYVLLCVTVLMLGISL